MVQKVMTLVPGWSWTLAVWIGPYSVILRHVTQSGGANYVQLAEARPIMSAICCRKIPIFDRIWLMTKEAISFSAEFSRKLTLTHLIIDRVVQHCATISATAELLLFLNSNKQELLAGEAYSSWAVRVVHESVRAGVSQLLPLDSECKHTVYARSCYRHLSVDSVRSSVHLSNTCIVAKRNNIHCVSKNRTPVTFSNSLNKYGPMLIIFGRKNPQKNLQCLGLHT